MSEKNNNLLSILLPQATIHYFVKDKETVLAAKSLVEDWRFARVSQDFFEGDVKGAIAYYAETASPDLVIIETDHTDDSLTNDLGKLAEHCAEGTAAIIVGPDNDVNLYRNLIQMGVSDYLVKSVSKETLHSVIAGTLIERIGASNSHLIAVMGAKGGVGVSTVSQILARSFAEIKQQKTILLNIAGGYSSLPVQFGFEPSTTLEEIVSVAKEKDDGPLKRLLFKASEKLDLVSSGLDKMFEPSVKAQDYEHLLDMVMKTYPVVIADLSGGRGALRRTVLDRANHIVLVAEPTLSSLRCARGIIQELSNARDGIIDNLNLVINKKGIGQGSEVGEKEIESALEFKPSVTLDFDPKFFLSMEGMPENFLKDKKGQIVAQKFESIFQKILGNEAAENKKIQKQGFLDNLLPSLAKKK